MLDVLEGFPVKIGSGLGKKLLLSSILENTKQNLSRHNICKLSLSQVAQKQRNSQRQNISWTLINEQRRTETHRTRKKTNK